MLSSDASRHTQIKALILILLLGCAESVRLDQEFKFEQSARMTHNSTGPEDDWRTENGKCSFHYSKLACGPSSGIVPDGSCAKRCMPLDVTYSQCCRLTDGYMLQNDRAAYFKLASGVLAAKAAKFKNECKGLSFYQLHQGRRCRRRAMHLMRSVEFMAKAQDSELVSGMDPEERAEQMRLFDDAQASMSEAIGPDGKYILILQQKMKRDRAGVQADPKESITKVMALLEKLLKGSEEEQAEARAEIEALPDMTESPTGELRTQRLLELEALAKSLESEKTETNSLMDATNYVEEEVNNEVPDESSLVERSSSSTLKRALLRENGFVAAVGFVVIVLLIVSAVVWAVAGIISAIVSWAVLSVLGCGIYSAGHNAALDSVREDQAGQTAAVAKRGVASTLVCIVKVFAAPFIFIGTAVSAAWRLIFQKSALLALGAPEEKTLNKSSPLRALG